MTIRLTPEAQADLDEIFGWYSERGSELGREFLAEFAGVLRRIEEFPQAASEIHVGMRRILLHRFPYCVFYVLEPTGPVILGCFHASRDPRIWRLRAGASA
jgi:plasmid stabilization system protein ParE